MHLLDYAMFTLSIIICSSFVSGILSGELAADSNKIFISFPCETNSDCKIHFNENTVCKRGKCVCEDGDNFNCLQIPRSILGEKCTHNINCDVIDSKCINHVCSCKEGYIGSASKQKCLPVAHNLNDSCEIDVQCEQNIPATVCFRGICICKLHYFDLNGTCYKKSNLGKACPQPENCLHIENAECNGNVCKCKPGYKEDQDLEFCLSVQNNTNNSIICNEKEQCVAKFGKDARCINSTCFCKEWWNSKGSECTPSAAPRKSLRKVLTFIGVSYVLLFVIFF